MSRDEDCVIEKDCSKSSCNLFLYTFSKLLACNLCCAKTGKRNICTSARMYPVQGTQYIDSKIGFNVDSSFTPCSLKWSHIFLYSSKVLILASRVLTFFIMKSSVFCPASRNFLARFLLLSWRWRQHFLPKLRLTCNGLYGVVSHRIEIYKSLLVSVMRATCVANIAVLSIIIQTVFGQEYNLQSSALFSYPLSYVYLLQRIEFSGIFIVTRN